MTNTERAQAALAEIVYLSWVKATGETNIHNEADDTDNEIASEILRLVALGMVPGLTLDDQA